MKRPDVLPSIALLRARVRSWREAADQIAMVPTMGALHAGHISLVDLAKEATERVVVSIFVNPKQFAPGEDFAKYPRTLDADLEELGAAGVDAVFVPPTTEIYPPGFATTITLAGPATVHLEDRFRPTHFQGVATVVAKLLISALPDVAVFGEKDYQQLRVIERLAADLALPVEILGAPIVRERDGLALSSRNVYLSPSERAAAPTLHSLLLQCVRRLECGEPAAGVLETGRADAAAIGFVLDYLDLRDAETLMPVDARRDRACRLLVAAYLGKTRLIDNVAVAAAATETEKRDR